MNCLRIPLSLEDADAVIVACSGVVDWRPMFVLGLQAAAILALAVVLIVVGAWRIFLR